GLPVGRSVSGLVPVVRPTHQSLLAHGTRGYLLAGSGPDGAGPRSVAGRPSAARIAAVGATRIGAAVATGIGIATAIALGARARRLRNRRPAPLGSGGRLPRERTGTVVALWLPLRLRLATRIGLQTGHRDGDTGQDLDLARLDHHRRFETRHRRGRCGIGGRPLRDA